MTSLWWWSSFHLLSITITTRTRKMFPFDDVFMLIFLQILSSQCMNVPVVVTHGLTHWGLNKWPTFCKRQMQFIQRKLSYFITNSDWQLLRTISCVADKTLPEPMIIEFSDATWRHWATMSQNGLFCYRRWERSHGDLTLEISRDLRWLENYEKCKYCLSWDI